MRRDIGLETGAAGRRARGPAAQQGALSLSVSYTSLDARKAMLVANTLASFFIEENLKVRERQASGTADFLQVQLEETKKRLEQQELQVAEFKERHMGELPQQVDANLKTLDRLQAQRKDAMDRVARSREQRVQLAKQMSDPEQASAIIDPVGARPDPLAARIAGLQRQLADLRVRFSDKYPDVIQLKLEIANLEDQQRKAAAAPKALEKAAPKVETTPARPETMLASLDADIKRGSDELDRLQREIDRYQQRIENAPRREQELVAMSRDYTSTRELYASLLKRREEATIAENMEQRQKGEQFRILDPAVMPESPTGPPRLFILAAGVGLGLVLGGALIVLVEALDGSFHHVDDLKSFARSPVLVTIPRIVTDADHMRARMQTVVVGAVVAVTVVVMFGASFVVARDNEQLVRALSRGPSLTKK
jgi:polysaccharide chain length determinant protein (PEP-CTERM system associated)